MAENFMLKIGASMDITQVEQAIGKINTALGQLKVDPKATAGLTKDLEKLRQQVEGFKQKSTDVTDEKDMAEVLKMARAITRSYDSLVAKIKVMSGLSGEAAKKLFPQEVVDRIKKASGALKEYQDKIGAAEKEVKKQEDRVAKINAEIEESAKAAGLTAEEFKDITKATEEARKELEKYNAELEEAKKAPGASDGRTKAGKKVKELTGKRDAAQAKVTQLEAVDPSVAKNADALATRLDKAENKARALVQTLSALKDTGGKDFTELTKSLKEITGLDLDGKDLQGIVAELEKMGQTDLANLVSSLQQAGSTAGEAAQPMKTFSDQTKDAANRTEEFNKQAGELAGLKQRITYFFGAANAISLFKRAIREAFNSVKQLDEIMTQTAVVTKFDVSDMWNQLPEYTKRANELGVAISDAYKSATLFYQQGLKTNEVIEVSNQTLKMARIAGLDAADATDKMTAALRGFNMEVNGTNAERISDVYSKLAAITASNVEEISTAMTKTASLASNAGMQFETTAAFLSQIIETTRESAETAGTALKTVIARFQELKKSPDEIGEVDGEIIDANKIETALRTVGVALRDTSGQFRDLDEVFMELASKWDSLDMNTQRYIATIAAGSRQQSRFVAMMSDYKRTQELVEAANNAAGASTEQYEKTLESMETALNRLKNAWNEFTMGIANNGAIKGVVKVITAIINAINKLTGKLGSVGGTIAKIGIVVVGLKAGGKFFDAFVKHFKELRKTMGPVQAGLTSIRKTLIGAFSGKPTNDLQKFINTMRTARRGSGDYNEALSAVKKALGENSAQVLAYNKAITAGVPKKKALLLLTNEEAAAEVLSSNATDKDTLSTIINTKAKQEEEAVEKISLGTKIKNIALLLFGNTQKRAEALVTLGLVKAKEADAVANEIATSTQWSFNAALYACPIGWIALAILAAVAALTIFIVLLAKAAKEKSYEARIKKINETINQTNENLQNTKDQLDDLNDKRGELSDLTKEFEGLTKGTDEWNEKLLEINQKVLDLINTYPELAQYLERDEVGRLSVSEEGWDTVTKNKQRTIATQTSALAAAQAQKQNLEAGQAAQDAYRKGNKKASGWAKFGRWAAATASAGITEAIRGIATGVNQARGGDGKNATIFKDVSNKNNGITSGSIEEFARLVSENNLTSRSSKQDLKKLYEDSGFTGDWDKFYAHIQRMGTSFDELGQTILKTRKSVDAFEESIINTTLTNNEVLKDSSVKDQIVELTKGQNEALSDNIEEEKEKMEKEYDGSSNKDERKELEKKYKKEVGLKDDDDVDMDTIYQYYATQKITNKLNESMETLNKTIVGLSNSAKTNTDAFNTFKRLLTKDAKKVTQADLDRIMGDKTLADLKAMSSEELKNFFNEFLNSIQEGLTLESIGVDENFMLEYIEKGTLSYQNAYKNLRSMGSNVTLGNAFVDASGTSGLAKMFEGVLSAVGEGAVTTLAEKLNPILNNGNWNIEDLNTFVSILNSMDPKSANEWEGLIDKLNQSGVNIAPDLQESIEEFAVKASETLGAIHKIDFTNLIEQTQTLRGILKNITEGKQGRTFDSDAYEAIVNNNKDLAKDFQLTLSGEYVYLGDSMESLRLALIENTQTILDEGNKQLVAQHGFYEAALKNRDIGNVALEGKTPDELRGLLNGILTDAHNGNVDINSLGVNGLGNDTTAWDLNDDQLLSVFEELRKVNWGSVQEEYAKNLNTAASAAYQADSSIYNARAMNNLSGKTDEESKNEFQNRKNALEAQAALVGVNDTLLKQLRDLTTESEGFGAVTKQVANQISILYSKNQMQEYLEGVQGLVEEYGKIEDAQLKIIKANEMASAFGIEVKTEKDADNIINLLSTFTQGSYESYEALITEAFAAVVNNPKGQEALTQKLLNAGLLVNEIDANGDSIVRALNAGELKTDTTIAGTYQEWENPYDFLTNANERINGLIRERNNLEKQYQRLIDKEGTSSEEITKNLKAQLELLKKQSEEQITKIQSINQEIQTLTSKEENKEFAQYISYDKETGSLIINDKAAESAFKHDANKGEAFAAYVDSLKELYKEAQDANDELNDIYDDVNEIKDTGKDQFLELEQDVFDGLVKQYEREIDKLSEIDQSVNNANSQLIDSLQSNIDKMRQDRANEKAASDIEDKQRRLDYLMMDSSGANSLEILKLQEEIANSQESYSDSLVDQAIQNMQDENQKAQEQREEQIEIMRAQLEYAQNSGALWSEVETIVREGFAGETSRLIDILKDKDNFTAMSEAQKAVWEEENENKFALAGTYAKGELDKFVEDETGSGAYTDVTETLTDTFGKGSEGSQDLIEETLSGTTGTKTSLGSFLQNMKGLIFGGYKGKDTGTPADSGSNGDTYANGALTKAKTSLQKKIDATAEDITYANLKDLESSYNSFINSFGENELEDTYKKKYANLMDTKSHIDEIELTNMTGKGFNWKDARKGKSEDGKVESGDSNKTHRVRVNGSAKYASAPFVQWAVAKGAVDGQVIKYNGEWWVMDYPDGDSSNAYALKLTRDLAGKNSDFEAFKTGGMADFTGPAWLDGTPTHPEAVLNAADTDRFINLIDVLRDIDTDGAGAKGDNYFDIQIEVDEISGDYDVDKMADRIKEIIVSDANYRNVNSIDHIR